MGAKERQIELEKLAIRAELKSADLEEDTGVIEQEALSRAPKSSSTPPRAKFVLALLNAKPSWQMVTLIAVIAGALAGGGLLRPVLDRVMGWVR